MINRFIKDTNGQFDLSSLAYTYVYANVSNNVSETPVIIKYNRVPFDKQIEYLQSTGTQYINLPLTVAKSTYFEVGGEITALHPNNNKYSLLGANPSAQFSTAFYSYNSSGNTNTYSSSIGNKTDNGGWSAVINSKTSFSLSTTKLYSEQVTNSSIITNKSVSRPLTANITSFRIFKNYTDSNGYPVKIHNFYVTVENNLIYNLIPVRVGQVGYMYDKVSGQLFGNSGTDSFVLGPDI